jgi:hypothetical protein
MAEVYERVLAKCERTNKHLQELESLIEQFLALHPYKFTTENDINRGVRVISCGFTVEPSLQISTVIEDILSGLRSTLDHIAYSLALRRDPLTKFKPYFPIEETFDKHKAKSANEIKAIGQTAVDFISTFEPYIGGKGEILWKLHSANNFAKHRLLPTVAGNITGHTIPPAYIEEIISGLDDPYYTRAVLRLDGVVISIRQSKPTVDKCGRLAAQAAGVSSAVRWSGAFARPGRIAAR